MIYWFVGQPCTGKSTLAKLFKERREKVIHCVSFDGDDLRAIFGGTYSKEHFTKEYRIEQTRALQRLVEYIAEQGYCVIVSTVNPYREVREELKSRNKEVQEIYVWKTDSRERDKFAVADYEPPMDNFISINTTGKTPDESLAEIFNKIKSLSL